MKTTKDVRKLLNEAHRIAVELVEGHARRILRTHANLDKFVMAMGTAFFTVKKANGPDNTLDIDSKRYFKPIADILDEFDGSLGITGTPMTFTADGPKITDW